MKLYLFFGFVKFFLSYCMLFCSLAYPAYLRVLYYVVLLILFMSFLLLFKFTILNWSWDIARLQFLLDLLVDFSANNLLVMHVSGTSLLIMFDMPLPNHMKDKFVLFVL
jgi:hypothetical protein